MASWQQIGPDTVDLGPFDGLVNTVADVLSALESALEIIAAALDVIGFLLFELPNVLEAIVSAAVKAVEEAILDILENNAALAVHLNTKWNADWKFERDEEDDPRRIDDFWNDGKLPWVGTGTQGWLLDIAFSTVDPTDPFRPITDEGTAVQGVIFIKGVPADGEFQQLAQALDVFFDFSDLKEQLNIKEDLQNATQAYKDLLRMGPAASDAVWKAVTNPDETIQGTLIATGLEGTNDRDSDFFYDLTWSVVGDLGDIEVGDALKLSDTPVYYEILEIVGGAQPGLRVEPPIARDHSLSSTNWEVRRGGVAGLLAALSPEFSDFRPVPGAYPKWVSVPLAAALPGLQNLFEGLRNLVNLLKVGNNHASALQNLARLLREKAALLAQIVEQLIELLDIIDALVDFFTQSYVIVLNNDSGGMSEFINTAIAADNLPDFGTRGVVIGATIVATAPEPANHFENLFSTIGLELSGFAEDVTERAEGLAETWEDEF